MAQANSMGKSVSGGWRKRVLARCILGTGLLLLVIGLPNEWGRLQGPIEPAVPLEWLLALGLLLVLPRPAARVLRWVLVAAAGVFLFVKLADMGTQIAFARLFNPILDLHLFVSGWHLLSGSVGRTNAILAIAATLLVFGVVLALLAWGLRGVERLPARGRVMAGGLALVAAFGGGLFAGLAGEDRPVRLASFDATRLAAERVDLLQHSLRDLAQFETDLQRDPAEAFEHGGILQGLAGKDVLFLFVESYGRSAVEGERYREAVRSRLAAIEEAIGTAGFSARSGWLTAPTVGGQSWLAHAALLSGLWVDSQQRYTRLMVSERASLNTLFARAGWRTIGVMPAITMDWPEARWYGYEATYVRDNLGYRGDPFNWVTMPDQYTLTAMNRFELDRAPRAPVMAEVSLISSHAPWTPIPPLLSWDEIGDGTIFNPFANAGDPPEVVWRDPERVRDQYALSIDYALEVVGSYVENFGSENLVLVVLGDHQPASIVTGPNASRDVPVHLIASDPAVFDAVADWNWSEGMVPDAAAPVWGMDAFRLQFLQAFEGAAPAR